MGKKSHIEDEIPLTHTTPNVTNETRARFDSLLQAALNQEAKGKEKGSDDVAEKTKLPKVLPRKTVLQGKKTDRSKQKHEGSPIKIQNTSPQVTSSDDDVIVMTRVLNDQIGIENEEVNRKNIDSFNASRELLILDNKSDENVLSYHHKEGVKEENNSDTKGVEVIRKNLRRERNKFDSIKEFDVSETSVVSPPSRLLKKPIPQPRRNKSSRLEENISLNESTLISGSLSPLLPKDQLDIKDSTDSDVCIAPIKPERKRGRRKNEGSFPENEGKTEAIELKDLKAKSATEVERKQRSDRKSSVQKSKGKITELVEETNLTKPEVQSEEFKYDKIIGIFIHRSDCLQVDPHLRHPLVKVHLLDATSGNYLKKSCADRSVSFYYENKDVDYILPLMTEVFDYKERRSVVPFWEELLVFNEDFQCILQNEPPALILFEILDFVNFTVASSQYRKLGSEGGWHQIAWAFLKPVGANGVLNAEKQVRLQLYKPQQTKKTSCNNCDVYDWWCGGIWKRYPATLYVTVKAITPPEHLPPVLRSRSALQGELSQSPLFLDLDQNQAEGELKSDNENSTVSGQLHLSTGIALPSWSRLPSQSCKIPNHRKLTLPSASRGCFYVKFSNSGLHLACSVAAEERFFIIVYSLLDGKEFCQFMGHQGLVYDLHWSPKDTMLLSASADCTACLWDTDARKTGPMQMLPHPSFLYCAQFHPGNSSVLVTGCCDHVVRVWIRPNKSSQYELVQELEGHTGFIGSLSISPQGMIYSADSVGLIIEWMGARGKTKKQCSLWKLNRKIDIRELRDTVVNKLQVHPGGQRLLIHLRDSRLRMVDLSTGSVIQWFNGALNHRVQTSACLSPCGGLVIAASEDGTVRVWNADTGEQLAIYSGLQFHRGGSGVDYHPFEHMTAFSSYGSPAQIIVCDYEKSSTGKDLGLQLLFPQNVSILENSQSGMGDVNYSYLKSSTPLGLSTTESGLFSGIKKNKKGFSTLDTYDSSNVMDHTRRDGPNLSPTTTDVASPWREHDETSRTKLAGIIEKMDQVLSRTPSKSSQQHSGSIKNLDYKISNGSPNKSDNEFYLSVQKHVVKQ